MIKTFAWDITSRCNFKCFYCNFGRGNWSYLEKVEGEFRKPEEIILCWENIYKNFGSCKIYITGGEPFCYPDFSKIVSSLARFHFIHITTNLSYELENFIDINKDFKKNIKIMATFHPLHIRKEKFLKNLLKLKKKRFDCEVNYLYHPVQIRESLNYKIYFSKFGFSFGITKFCGEYKSKIYPESFTKEENNFFDCVSKYSTSKRKFFNFVVKENIDNTNLCNAGKDYFSIFVNGDIRRCGKFGDEILGNIYKGKFNFYQSSKRCSYIKNCEEYIHYGRK